MNRRELIRVLSGGIAGISAIQSIERISADTNEVIIITYPNMLKHDQMLRVRQTLEGVFKNAKVLVMEGGPSVKVMRQS